MIHPHIATALAETRQQEFLREAEQRSTARSRTGRSQIPATKLMAVLISLAEILPVRAPRPRTVSRHPENP